MGLKKNKNISEQNDCHQIDNNARLLFHQLLDLYFSSH